MKETSKWKTTIGTFHPTVTHLTAAYQERPHPRCSLLVAGERVNESSSERDHSKTG